MTSMAERHRVTRRGRVDELFSPVEPLRPRRGLVWAVNLATLLVTSIVMYQLFPHFTQNVFFDGILRNGWYIAPWLLFAWYAVRVWRRGFDISYLGEHRREIAVGITLVVFALLANVMVYAMTDYLTYRAYASNFRERGSLVAAAPGYVRFTPRQNACADIGNSISTTSEHVGCTHVQPIITAAGFGYATPIMPSGVLQTFLMSNPGFLFLDDSFAAEGDPTKRLTRIDDVQQVGPGMEWRDNLDYVLAKTDFFANYDDPHYLALDPANPQKLTMVVSKIKYGLFFRLPYWGGVMLVHSDGRVEDLSAEEAMRDKRLAGQWIYPISLARRYVHLQNYATGWGIVTSFVRVPGKLEIEKLPGDNQFPFLTHGSNGRTYLVTATKGEGSAQGLFRMYFVDATTGEGTYHQFGTHEVVYGAGASLTRLTNIPGYQWHHGGKESSGTIVATEPVYVVRPNDRTLYWKATITNINYSGISATAVASASRPDDIKVFNRRADFDAWLYQREAPIAVVAPAGGDLRGRFLRAIEDLAQRLNGLRKEAESLPR